MPIKELPWVMKYRPKRIGDVVDQDNAKREFVAWLNQWLRGKPDKKAALLYGPPGCGKTSLVEAAANEYNLELIEMNASDFRRRQDIEGIVKIAATQMSLFGKKGKIILLDEVDGISGTADRGGLDAILDLINATRHPVVMTANDPWDQKLRPLRDVSKLIAFNRLTETVVAQVLKNICLSEGIECEPQALRYIAKLSEGDLRSAINDLEAIARGYGKVTLSLAQMLVRRRDREYTPFEALRNLFMSRYAWQAKQAVTQTNVDYETMLQWINENIPNQYTDVEDIWRAYEALSRATVYLGRIRRTASWDLLSYVFDTMGPGVALARVKSKYKWAKYSFPQRILMMAKTKQVREIRDSLARHLASKLHVSSRLVKSEFIPILRIIFLNSPRYAARIALGYNLTENMVKYLAGPRGNEVLRYLNELKKGKVTVGEETRPAITKATKTVSEAATTRTARRSTRTRRRRGGRGGQTQLPF